jgi:Glycosyl transferase family 2
VTRPNPSRTFAASVVIPAHNEERTIGRLLSLLTEPTEGAAAALTGQLEIVVVCNGCSDSTAEVARRYGVVVRELAEPSKQAALHEGHGVATAYPRILLDADVELTRAGALSLAAAVGTGPALAAGPRRLLPRDGVARLVRWYYDVWEALPAVRTGLFGRGVVALAEEGVQRVRALPPTMSDDLAFSEAFDATERIVVDEVAVIVHPPRTWQDLIRRRARVVTGNVQADRQGIRGKSAQTGMRSLLDVLRRDPRLAGKIPVFVVAGVMARRRARRAVRAGDFTTWERDESSRLAASGPVDS